MALPIVVLPRALAMVLLTPLLAVLLSLGDATLAPSPAHAAHAARCGELPLRPTAKQIRRAGKPWHRHPGRVLVPYRVRPGDSAGLIATRCHAWTAELIAVNRLRRTLQVGQSLRVPIVVAAMARAPGAKPRGTTRPPHVVPKRVIRTTLVKTAARHRVPRSLVLAIAWQESGWQQHVRSHKGAIGTMQVMPGTGRWLSTYSGRKLHIRRLHDNVEAGVLLLKILRNQTSDRRAIGAYYQGLGAIREHGFYDDTKRYVRSVTALQKAFKRGWDPLR